MKKHFCAAAALITFSLIVSPAFAGDESQSTPSLIDATDLGGKVTGMVTFTTEYISRGLTQTKPGVPAVQGQLEFDHDSGFYLNAFGSNVKFQPPAETASVELDYAVGFRNMISESMTYDLTATYFTYPGAKRSDGLAFDYVEFRAKGAYDFDIVAPYLAVNYSPEYQFNSGEEWYFDGGVDIPLGRYFTANLHVGRSMVDNNARAGWRDYWDYSVGLTTNIAGLDVNVSYVTSDLQRGGSGLGSCGTSACDRVVLTVSKTF
jgi:uncharacterized protein (TIGR02001 family)